MPRRTLISTSAYGKANKVPQEAVPQEVQDKVRDECVCVGAGARRLIGRGALCEPGDMPQEVQDKAIEESVRVCVQHAWLAGGGAVQGCEP